MRMISKLIALSSITVLVTVGAVADEPLDAETAARIAKAEAGAKELDVSKYPQALRGYYKTFSEKCSQCHSLARPINSEFALPDEWSRYVKRMMRKPGSGISPADAKQIYEFLAYDSAVRKPKLVEEKLKAASAEERAAAEAAIKKIKDEHEK